MSQSELSRDRSDSDRPWLLDVCCGAGGMAKGLYDAGFMPVGIDIKAQPNYPFEFHQIDALTALVYMDRHWMWTCPQWLMRPWAAIHASPPCQARSDLQKQSKILYAELVPPIREMLEASGLPYVIENVEGTTADPQAQLRDPITLCGTMFPGLRVIRHRLFESNVPLEAPPHPPGRHPLVFTHDKRKAHHGQLDQDTAFVQVTGGGNCSVANAKAAMGIDWMTKDELNEAIPPAYGEHIGRQLMAHVAAERVAA